MFNFATILCKRVNVKEIVTSVPIYASVADGSSGGLSLILRCWATKKTAGSTKNGRDSKPKFLGVKKFGGEAFPSLLLAKIVYQEAFMTLLSSNVGRIRCFSSAAVPHVLKVGDVLRQKRIFSSEDIVDYAKVSHDINPVHFDSQAALDAGFDDQLVHGLLVAAIFPKIISSNFPGAVYASQSLRFKLPVYVGEEVSGEVQASDIRGNKNKYIAKFSTRCFKNNDLFVLDGEAIAILPIQSLQPVPSA